MKKLSNQEKHKQFLPFDKAQKFVHSLKLKRQKDWVQYRKSGNKPDNIPSNPNRTYKKEWKNLGDWLGTGNIRPADRKFKTFLEARDYVHSLYLKDVKDWRKFTKSGKLPNDIPAWPPDVYKNKGWISWGDWLDTGIIATFRRQYLKFNDAQKYVHSLKLKTGKEWTAYCKSGNKPDDIPASPEKTYKKQWISLGDWLGTGKLGPKEKRKQYLSFQESRKFIRKLKLKNRVAWRKYSKSNQRPIFIPSSPEKIYKKEWINMGDWLGTGTITTRLREYSSFDNARKYVHSLGLKNQDEWRKFAKSPQKLKDIPADPANVYKNKGWKNMGNWLGTGFVATKERKYMSWKEAKPLYAKISKVSNLQNQSDWKKYTKTHKLPKGLPPDPWQVYTQKNILRRTKKK